MERPERSEGETVNGHYVRIWNVARLVHIKRWATGWLIEGVRVPIGAGNFSPHPRVQTCCEAPPSLLSIGYQSFFPWE
jgi:hypothetical protein